jgi:hypothetical protein
VRKLCSSCSDAVQLKQQMLQCTFCDVCGLNRGTVRVVKATTWWLWLCQTTAPAGLPASPCSQALLLLLACCLPSLQELARAKDAAVAAEDYDEAKRLKASIERLKVCSKRCAASTAAVPQHPCPLSCMLGIAWHCTSAVVTCHVPQRAM